MNPSTELSPSVLRRRDYRDGVIEELADELAAARAVITTLTEACETYKVIAVEACAQLHTRHSEITRLRKQLDHLKTEFRTLRASVKTTTQEAA